MSINLARVNHMVLRKQHLTVDSQIDNVVQVVQDVGGLHATISTTPFLSLFARCRDFKKEYLDEALYVHKNLGRIRCMRKSIYILSKEMMPAAHGATASMVENASKRFMERRGVSSEQYGQMSRAILRMLGDGEMTASEIKQALGTSLDVSSILYFMCDRGLLIRGRSSKGWRDKRHSYGLFGDYFPDVALGCMDESQATALLVRQYLKSFAPATENDIVWWTGLGKRKVRLALNSQQERLATFGISGLQGEFIALQSDLGLIQDTRLRSEPEVLLLPVLDPYLMGYKERTRYLDEAYYAQVFDRSGNATSAILLDGRVAGVWDSEHNGGAAIKLFLFRELGRHVHEKIYHVARRIGTFITDQQVDVKTCDEMKPLTQRPAGSVMTPLKDC